MLSLNFIHKNSTFYLGGCLSPNQTWVNDLDLQGGGKKVMDYKVGDHHQLSRL